jgi:hypothetical protein
MRRADLVVVSAAAGGMLNRGGLQVASFVHAVDDAIRQGMKAPPINLPEPAVLAVDNATPRKEREHAEAGDPVALPGKPDPPRVPFHTGPMFVVMNEHAAAVDSKAVVDAPFTDDGYHVRPAALLATLIVTGDGGEP